MNDGSINRIKEMKCRYFSPTLKNPSPLSFQWLDFCYLCFLFYSLNQTLTCSSTRIPFAVWNHSQHWSSLYYRIFLSLSPRTDTVFSVLFYLQIWLTSNVNKAVRLYALSKKTSSQQMNDRNQWLVTVNTAMALGTSFITSLAPVWKKERNTHLIANHKEREVSHRCKNGE